MTRERKQVEVRPEAQILGASQSCIDESRGARKLCHVYRVEAHDLFIKKLLQLFATDVVLVDCERAREVKKKIQSGEMNRRTIKLEEFWIERWGDGLVVRIMLYDTLLSISKHRLRIHARMPRGRDAQAPVLL